MPAIDCKLDGSENVYVHDNGDSWTKFRTKATWDGAALTVTSTTLNGWWKDSNPADVISQPTQLEEVRTFTLGPDRAFLRMQTESHDEKPYVVRYTDSLTRQDR